jgi:hypothetical protein
MPLIPLPATPIRLIFLGGSSRIAKALFSLSRFMRSSRPFFSSSYSSSSSSSKMRFAPTRPNYRLTNPDQHLASAPIPTRLTLEDEDDDEGRGRLRSAHLLPLLAPSNSLQISVAASLVANPCMFFDSWFRRDWSAKSSSISLPTVSPLADAESITSAADAC